MPQDVKLSPDGRIFYVADMMAGGVWVIGARPVPRGRVHRDRRRCARALPEPRRPLPVRLEPRRRHDLGDQLPHARASCTTWRIPAAAAPTWAASRPTARCCGSRAATTPRSTRSTRRTGHLLARIPVGAGPHGLCVWPQPGRYSLGHTGILRRKRPLKRARERVPTSRRCGSRRRRCVSGESR